MTDSQMKVKNKQIIQDILFTERKFRKECVTQGIVKFIRCYTFYKVEYRGEHVCYLFGNSSEEKLKLQAVWDVIKISEKIIEKIEGEKHESK